jgi:hypothetical protein
VISVGNFNAGDVVSWTFLNARVPVWQTVAMTADVIISNTADVIVKKTVAVDVTVWKTFTFDACVTDTVAVFRTDVSTYHTVFLSTDVTHWNTVAFAEHLCAADVIVRHAVTFADDVMTAMCDAITV